jgi:hypothetical protein
MRRFLVAAAQLGLTVAIGYGAGLAVQAVAGHSGSVQAAAVRTIAPGAAPSGCVIKGNVSIGTGERIYHMPGQQYYDQTVISPEYGERWFCSEQEAQAAGWRRAGI